MLFYSITGMHFIHVTVTASMVHAAIFYTKHANISVPTGTKHLSQDTATVLGTSTCYGFSSALKKIDKYISIAKALLPLILIIAFYILLYYTLKHYTTFFPKHG